MVAGPDPDPEEHLYYIEISSQNEKFFKDILEAHKEVFGEPPEGGDWLYTTIHPSVSEPSMPPEGIEAVVQIILDVWREDVLAVDDRRFHELISGIEIEAWDDDQVPDVIKD